MFLLFLCGGIVLQFVVLTSIMNHVRMFIAAHVHRNEVLGVTPGHRVKSTKTYDSKTREESSLPHDGFERALLICLVPAGFLRAFQSSFVHLRRYLFPWTLSFLLINASVNPMINFWWNKELRNAIRLLSSCLVKVQT